MKRILKRAANSLGYEVRRIPRPPIGPIDFIRHHTIDLVLDVGANEGQFALGLRRAGYCGEIVSFEPVASVYNVLALAAESDPQWSTRQVALGNAPGTAQINVSNRTVYSSILPQTPTAASFDAGSIVTRTEEVIVTTVDDVMREFPDRRAMLKVDTQGFDSTVIAGAARSLPGFIGVLREVAIVPLYQGAQLFQDVVRSMYDAGFLLSQVHPVIYQLDDPSSLMEVDCLFIRSGYITNQPDPSE